MSFPNPPVADQLWTHPESGLEYQYNETLKAWELIYATATTTASLPLANPSTLFLPSVTGLPDSSGLATQQSFNVWTHSALIKVDETSRVDAGEDSPDDADTNQLWYKPSTGSLYVYYNDGSSSQWIEIGTSTTGGGSTYTLETDPDVSPQIQLVDQDDNFSNVHMRASGSLTVESDADSITIKNSWA